MDLTPQLLHAAEFREARRGGYDTRDVDEFLERVAVGVGELQERLRDALQRADAAEARVADAEARAREAAMNVRDTTEADETLKRTLVLAQRTADAAIKEAEEQARQTLGAARDEADRLLAEARQATATAKAEAEEEARRGADEVRQAVLTEVTALNDTRDTLLRDAEALQLHIETQRARIGVAAAELQRLLDDPDALYELAMPEVIPVALPVDEADAPEEEVLGDDDDFDEPTGAIERGSEWDFVDEPSAPRPAESIDPLAERDLGDDSYLAELRKAMTDETPLGSTEQRLEEGADLFDTEPRRRERSRFGRRS